MNKIFEQNMNQYKKKYADAASFLATLAPSSNYETLKSENDNRYLRVNGPRGEILIDDPKDPQAAIIKYVPQGLKQKCFFVVMGIGLGYLLFEAVKQYPQSLFVVIEHDPRIFKAALEAHDFTPYIESSQIHFIVGVKPDIFYKYFSEFMYRDNHSDFLPALYSIANHPVVSLSKDYYQKIADSIGRCTEMYWETVVGNDIDDTLIGLKNLFQNLNELPRMMSIEPYQNHFEKKMGIVVSSGPSLNNKLEYLHAVQDKAIIICADSALKLLLENGIKPFGVCSTERVPKLTQLYEGFEIPNDIHLFFLPYVDPKIVKNYVGPLCLILKDLFPYDFLPELMPARNVGMSCAHLSLTMLLLLGCRKVGLVGQDLAYARGSGKTHFDGVIDYAAAAEAERDKIEVPDHQGGMIASNEWWILFRDFFTMLVQHNPSCQVVNVIESTAGAKIEAVERVDPNIFFTEVVNETHMLEKFDDQKGLDHIQIQISKFQQTLGFKIKAVVAGLEAFTKSWVILKTHTTFTSYQKEKNKLLAGTAPDVSYFYLSIYKSHYKRFDAAAQCLWDDEEFCKNLPEHVDLACEVMQKTIAILKGFKHK